MVTAYGEKYYTLPEAAEEMGITENSVRYYTRIGRLSSILVSNKKWIPETSMRELMQQKGFGQK